MNNVNGSNVGNGGSNLVVDSNMGTRKRAKTVSYVDFVAANLSSSTIDEVVAKTGYSRSTVQQKRTQLRSEGLDLPEFARGTGRIKETMDLEQLKKMIEDHLNKGKEVKKEESDTQENNTQENNTQDQNTETAENPIS